MACRTRVVNAEASCWHTLPRHWFAYC